MSHQEPPRKLAEPPSPLSPNSSDDSMISLEHLYALDTLSDQTLEIDPATIPTGPDDGPTWTQHNFSYLDLPIELVSSLGRQQQAFKTESSADEVDSALGSLLNRDAPPIDTVHAIQSQVLGEPNTDQCSSTESELTRLY